MQFKYDYRENTGSGENTVELLHPGEGAFKIRSVWDTNKDGSPMTTQKGEPKIRVDVMVTDMQGNHKMIFEHLTAKMGWKLGAMLHAIGKAELYNEKGEVDPRHLVGGVGKCIIKTRNEIGFPPASVIDYIETDAVVPIKELPVDTITPAQPYAFKDEPLEDDLPF